jgi:hypothetical protein
MSEEDARYICVMCYGYISHADYRRGHKTCHTCSVVKEKIEEYKGSYQTKDTTDNPYVYRPRGNHEA